MEADDSEDDVDVMIDKMGLTVSDGDGNAIKLSKFISLKGRKETRGRNSTREERELKKLAWDMNDVTGGERGDKIRHQSYFMKILTWNIKGLGGYKKKRLVCAAILKCCPDIVVLQETKKDSLSNRLVKWTVGLDLSKWCVTSVVGTAGVVLCA